MEGEGDRDCNLLFPLGDAGRSSISWIVSRPWRNVRSSTRMAFGSTSSERRSPRNALWAGVDLRTVQQWLGHSDMESTMRYLKPSRSQQTRDKVNEIFA